MRAREWIRWLPVVGLAGALACGGAGGRGSEDDGEGAVGDGDGKRKKGAKDDEGEVGEAGDRARGDKGPAGGPEGKLHAGMVLVPAGRYPYGSDPKKDKGRYPGEESDDAREWLDAFWIDEHEYPNEKGTVPRAAVPWTEAAELCARGGKRLCSEPEWEAACEGADGAVYGYGAAFDPAACDTGKDEKTGAPAPSGSFASCKSPLGVFDMPGGLAEWTAEAWRPGSRTKVARSGAFSSKDRVLRCANRIPRPIDSADPKYGFRCCADPDEAPARIPAPLDELVPAGKMLADVAVATVTAKAPAGFSRCLVGPMDLGPSDDSRGPFDVLTWTWCGKPSKKKGDTWAALPVVDPAGKVVTGHEGILRKTRALATPDPVRAELALAWYPMYSVESSEGEAYLALVRGEELVVLKKIDTLGYGDAPWARAWRFAPGLVVIDYQERKSATPSYEGAADPDCPECGEVLTETTEPASCKRLVLMSDGAAAGALFDEYYDKARCPPLKVDAGTIAAKKRKLEFDGNVFTK